MKHCPRCTTDQPTEAFARNPRTSDRLQTYCRACCAAYAAQWRAANIERKREMDRAYALRNAKRAREKTKAWAAANPERKRAADSNYRIANRDRLREQRRAWEAANPERHRAAKRAWAEANRERLREQRRAAYYANADANRAAARAWALANPEKRQAQRADRKARKMKARPPWADAAKIAEFYAYARHLTAVTGVPHHVDHIVPLKSTKVCGLHCEFNLQVIPAAENMKKRNRFEPG